jgi:hypothetical protein
MYWPCCFKDPVRRPGETAVTGFELTEETEEALCTDDPWIILHKLDSPTKMRYIGQRFASCAKGPHPEVVPASIAAWVARIGARCCAPALASTNVSLEIVSPLSLLLFTAPYHASQRQ